MRASINLVDVFFIYKKGEEIMRKFYEEPNEIPEEEVEILQDPEEEKEGLRGADEPFDESKERPNEKDDE